MTTDTTPSHWGILRRLLTDEYDRLDEYEKDPETGLWFGGMRHGIRSALAYMDGLDGRERVDDESGAVG